MTTQVEISHRESNNGGQYEARVPGNDAIGLLTYQRKRDGTVVADHTLVPDELSGKGIASALVNRLIADARTNGFRIEPQCSFVRAKFERHPEWAELRAD